MAFMRPEIQTVADLFALGVGITPESLGISEEVVHPYRKYMARLSAPGYLDATDWQGPYNTEEEAMRDLCQTFGLCETCHEEGWDCTCETNDDDEADDGESRLYGPEPLETPPTSCRACNDSDCQGCW